MRYWAGKMGSNFEKEKLRKKLKHQRQVFAKTVSISNILPNLYQNFLSLNLLSKTTIIGGYWAMGAEVPLLPLLEKMHQQGHTIVLPSIKDVAQLMEFKKWSPYCEMKLDACGIPAPITEENFFPELLLVPLVGFDKTGARLGQGLGYYDAFIHHLKTKQSLQTVGIAYEIQKVNHMPLESHDQLLDFIVTEKQVYKSRSLNSEV